MAILEILTYPDEFLRQTTKTVEVVDDAVQQMIDDMADTMYEAPGVGLAAPQIGSDKRIIVFDPTAGREGRNLQVLINPVILFLEGEYISEDEGCLSVPGLRANVKRAAYAVVEGLDRNGEPRHIEAREFLAVLLQHEIDHLEGILFLDRISKLKREMYKRKIKKQLKNK